MDDGTVVIVECPDCGASRVSPYEVALRNCVTSNQWEYRARCPRCACTFLGGTSARAALAAAVAGSPIEYWELPAELAEQPFDAPALTLDEVRSMVGVLHDDDALTDELERLPRH